MQHQGYVDGTSGYPPPLYAPPPMYPPGSMAPVGGPPPPSSTARHGVHPGWVAAIAVGCLVAGIGLGAGGTFIATQLAQGDDSTATAGWEGGPAAERLPEQLPELVAFVEERTGVSFQAEPAVSFLADDEFVEALLSSGGADPQGTETAEFDATALALGLISDREAFLADQENAYTDAVLGFYDSGSKELVVRGTDWTPMVETTVVHELVHALQDEQVDLDEVTRRTSIEDESYMAMSAIAEGQATAVETDWLYEQSDEYNERYAQDQSSGWWGEPSSEPLTDVLMMLPYDLGWQSVVDLEEHTGPVDVFAVLGEPPTTLEQVYDLPGWRSHDDELAAPVDVAAPAVPGSAELVDAGSLGAYVLALLVMVDDPDSWYLFENGLVEGWAGDRYVTWTEAGQVCTSAAIQMDDDTAVAQLQEDLADFVDNGGAVAAGAGAVLTLERCTDE